MRLLLGIVFSILMLLPGASRQLEAEGLVCAGVRFPALSPPNRSGAAKPATGTAAGTRRALALFARFRGEDSGQLLLPDWAEGIFDPELPGSFTHFYTTMSFGKLRVTGGVGPRWYESAQPASFYLAEGEAGQLGRFGQFSQEILRQADPEIDFSRFDSDGPDGVANSGDDDGVVDALFLVLASTPASFILADAAATGVAGLGFEEGFITDDMGAAGALIRIFPDQGTLQQGRSMAEAVGAMAHEYGHLLGLPDLYNTEFLRRSGAGPEQDGAGIGRWGLMGWGARGWSGDRPASLSAWSRLQLGWAQVVEPALEEEMRLEEVGRRGMLYQIPLSQREFFLIEYRRRTSSYYDRDIPAEGLLIWHVERTLLTQEALSRVDLECADGRWRDAGFPLGAAPAPEEGEDNLDFWAHDAEYAQRHGGNLGDATDVFDGQRSTAFTPTTNPSSYSSDRRRSVRIEQIRIEDGMARAAIHRDPPRIEIAALELPASGEVVAGQPTPILFALRNSGGTNATGLTARLRTADPLVEVLDPEVALNDLAMDGEHRGAEVAPQGFPRVRFTGGFAGMRTATFTLEIYGHGKWLAGREFPLTARSPYHLSGKVVSDTGEPLPGTSVVARGAGDYRASAVADAEGRYELSVLPGQYDLFIRPASGQRVASQRRTGLSIFADQQLDFVLPALLEIAGTITDADGAPLRGVFVVGNRKIEGNAAESFYVQTNDDGFYRLHLQRGTYLLRAVPGTGMREIFAQQEIGEVELDQDRAIDVQLQRGVQVTVQVTDERGQEVNGVTVQLRGAETEIYPEVLTRMQGAGTVNVLPGVRLIAVAEPLPAPYVLPDSFLVAVARDTTVQVVLPAGSWITGELRDVAGGEVDSQGQIVFTAVAGRGQFEAQVEEGRYAIGLARGGYRVQWQRFSSGTFPPQELGQVEVAGDAVVDLALEEGFTVQGRVVDDQGQPLAGGTLRFRSLAGGLAVSAGVTTTGEYAASLLAGEHQVAIHFLGSPLPDQKVDAIEVAGEGRFDFAIQRGAPIVGRVVDGGGEGLPGVSVTAYALDAAVRGTTRSGADGGFNLPLPANRYRLALSAPHGARSTTWVVEEVAVPLAGPLELSPPAGARLTGRVVDGRGRLAKGMVLLTRDPRALYDRAHTGYVAAVSTGGDGFYEIAAPPGEYALVAYPSGQFQLGSVQWIRLDSDRVVDLELPTPVEAQSLVGRLLDEQGAGVGAALLQFYSASEGRSGQVQTEGDGYYHIELPSGRYQAAAALSAGVGYGQAFALGEVEVDGKGERDLLLSQRETAVQGGQEAGPEGFSLAQNYPNPFNAATVIVYRLAQPAAVKLAVYNLAGQPVATLAQGHRQAGVYTVNWGGRDDRGRRLASGIYLYRLEAGRQRETRKLLLLQ